jgi:hypothetical protein
LKKEEKHCITQASWFQNVWQSKCGTSIKTDTQTKRIELGCPEIIYGQMIFVKGTSFNGEATIFSTNGAGNSVYTWKIKKLDP